jgi:hypothetical protein
MLTLRHYRYEVDEKVGEPLHDQYSYAADAFRTTAVIRVTLPPLYVPI